MTSSVTHPVHQLRIIENEGRVMITSLDGLFLLDLNAEQSRWLARELEHLR